MAQTPPHLHRHANAPFRPRSGRRQGCGTARGRTGSSSPLYSPGSTSLKSLVEATSSLSCWPGRPAPAMLLGRGPRQLLRCSLRLTPSAHARALRCLLPAPPRAVLEVGRALSYAAHKSRLTAAAPCRGAAPAFWRWEGRGGARGGTKPLKHGQNTGYPQLNGAAGISASTGVASHSIRAYFFI